MCLNLRRHRHLRRRLGSIRSQFWSPIAVICSGQGWVEFGFARAASSTIGDLQCHRCERKADISFGEGSCWLVSQEETLCSGTCIHMRSSGRQCSFGREDLGISNADESVASTACAREGGASSAAWCHLAPDLRCQGTVVGQVRRQTIYWGLGDRIAHETMFSF